MVVAGIYTPSLGGYSVEIVTMDQIVGAGLGTGRACILHVCFDFPNKSCYCQTSNVMRTKSQNLNVSRLVFAKSAEARCLTKNEDVAGSTPTGDTPTTYEWSSILLPTNVRCVLEVWRYILNSSDCCLSHLFFRGWLWLEWVCVCVCVWWAVREITKSSNTFSATNISSNIVWLLQLHDTI